MTRTAPPASPARLALYAQAREHLLGQRQALLASLQERESEGSRVQHAQQILSQDSDDAEAHDADREVDLAQSNQSRLQLADISAALVRLEAGTYGDCADCGEPIAPQRLQVQPQALRCVACAGKREGAAGHQARVSL